MKLNLIRTINPSNIWMEDDGTLSIKDKPYTSDGIGSPQYLVFTKDFQIIIGDMVLDRDYLYKATIADADDIKMLIMMPVQ